MNTTGAMLAVSAVVALAQGASPGAQHTIVGPTDIKWGEAPPVLPPGAKMAVLYGDPTKAGPFVVRLRTPANYRIMPHTHPTDENVTVISGGLAIGMGSNFDPTRKVMPPGSFMSLPANMAHFAFTKQETVLEISSMGPFAITYINPADDPSRAATR